jgi:hypothetical protein
MIYRRVDSRSTNSGEINIVFGAKARFAPIRASNSSEASSPILQVRWSTVLSGTDNTSE